MHNKRNRAGRIRVLHICFQRSKPAVTVVAIKSYTRETDGRLCLKFRCVLHAGSISVSAKLRYESRTNISDTSARVQVTILFHALFRACISRRNISREKSRSIWIVKFRKNTFSRQRDTHFDLKHNRIPFNLAFCARNKIA